MIGARRLLISRGACWIFAGMSLGPNMCCDDFSGCFLLRAHGERRSDKNQSGEDQTV